MSNKKALSEVVSYVLLIVIAISLSIAVFVWLKVYVPKDKLECPDGVSVIIKNYQCGTSGKIAILFENKGRFKVDGIYMKAANTSDDAAPSQVLIPWNDGDEALNNNPLTLEEGTLGFIYFGRGRIPTPLGPGKEYNQNFSFTKNKLVTRIQVHPFLNDEENQKVVICEAQRIIQDVENCVCTAASCPP